MKRVTEVFGRPAQYAQAPLDINALHAKSVNYRWKAVSRASSRIGWPVELKAVTDRVHAWLLCELLLRAHGAFGNQTRETMARKPGWILEILGADLRAGDSHRRHESGT